MATSATTSTSGPSDSQTSSSPAPAPAPTPAAYAEARRTRPSVIGDDAGLSHEQGKTYPIYLRGDVQKGFGRGGKELGCATANLPSSVFDPPSKLTETGVYFGYASVDLDAETGGAKDGGVWPMVMSVGWNPFYKNEQKTAEVHIMHEFQHDFYGKHMKVVVLGYIRPEFNYVSREALIEDIETDKQVGLRSLDRPAWSAYKQDSFFAEHAS
ncbi:riboflavin kinase [Ceraceosorus guamensis]|uniref:Riboflavin kinase n=1 Tax=Ceraceosorus guamensis TaxID=1522189 RepID=A0A316VVI5_9BASI|nr:riboflavin kinase [Ceraceosorus guamensis]PWN41469.1 riboflavin kinase [Ceraceosorus guamensis]